MITKILMSYSISLKLDYGRRFKFVVDDMLIPDDLHKHPYL